MEKFNINSEQSKLTLTISLLVALACAPIPALVASYLGSAENFAVIVGSTVTNTGPATVYEDLGIWPGTVITGPGSIHLMGAVHQMDALAQQAQLDALNAYTTVASQGYTVDLTGQDLASLGTLTPGIYHFDSTAQLTGALNPDAQNDPNTLFIFQTATGLMMANSAVINVLNDNVNSGAFWQVGGSATLGTSTLFAKNTIADQSITLKTTAQILCGRAFARNAAVTMDTNTVSNDCSAFNDDTIRTDYGGSGFRHAQISAVPVPAAPLIIASGLFGVVGVVGVARTRRRSLVAA